MKRKQSSLFLAFALSVVILGACSKKETTTTPKTPTTSSNTTSDTTTVDTTGTLLSCAASLPSSFNGRVTSGQTAPITIQAIGGVGPYQLENYSGNFSASKTISRSYTNSGTSNILVSETFQVIDAQGRNAQCDLDVTVTPVGGSPSTLACALSVNPTSPHISENFEITLTASGGSGTYSAASVDLGSDSVWVSTLTGTTPTVAKGTAKYTVAALKTLQGSLTDSSGGLANCSLNITVRPNLSLTLSASPSATVNVGTTIVVTATPVGFSGTPSYTFSYIQPGVVMASSGNAASFSVSDSLAHGPFIVSVSATSGSETVTNTISLSFTQQVLNCTMTRTGTLTVNQTQQFQVTATSGAALEFTEFLIDSGGTITGSSSSIKQVKYTSAGARTVLAKARSISSGVVCNGGAYLQTNFTIASAVTLSCSAFTNPTFSYAGNWVQAGSNVTHDSGAAPVKLYSVCTSGQCFYPDATSLYMWLNFSGAGTYPITMTVKDALGNSATCSTSHIVY